MSFPLTSRPAKIQSGVALLVAAFGLALLPPARAVEVEPPPAVYTERIAPRLTPVDEVLRLADNHANPQDGGSILLDERLISVDDEGRRTTVWHFAYKTLTDAGVKSNSDDTFTFRKHDQKPYLVLAETIQPDGTRQPVQANAILIQSPQRQAEYSLYDDQAEFKIIFPNVKPGSVTHGIFILQDTVARFPGEACLSFVWAGSWARERARFSVDLPAAIARRTKVETLGSGVPEMATRDLADGRRLYTWDIDGLRPLKYEVDAAPDDQVGPAIHLSSIASWNDVGRWYHGLLSGRGELKPELTKLADSWTAGLKGRDAIIAALHAQVADEVRYVGLEFGSASYQPHDCNEVWTNRYGDCKDKANLLVALLRRHKIDASIALVNTEHLGLVDKRTPDFRIFDHAIVAVRDGKRYLFCDPTIAGSTPGMIGTTSADRDVLVMTDGGAEWVHTPPATSGELSYDFDLKLAESGDLSGWFTLKATGYYAARERRRFQRLDAEEIRSQMSRIIRGFYSAAEVIDAERGTSPRDQPFVGKAYFTVAGAARETEHKQALSFPWHDGLFVNVGDSAERRTSYFLDTDTIKVTSAIALPGEFAPEQAVAPFRLDSTAAKMQASWNFAGKTCRAELLIAMKGPAVRRDEFAGFYRGVQSAKNWLAQPVVLTARAGANSTVAAAPEFDFPLMPTAEGQLNLADTRYPENGDPELRRRALERTIQYYPNDKTVVFRAGVRLAVIDWNADRNEAAHERLTALLKKYSGQIAIESYAWGESVDGWVLHDLKRDADALVLLERVTRNKQLSDDRRARAAPLAAELLSRKSMNSAIDLLREISALPEGHTPAVEAKLAHLLLRAKKPAEMEAHVRKIVESRPDTCDAELAEILDVASEWKEADDAARLDQLVKTVRALRPQPGEALAKALAKTTASAAIRLTHAQALAALAGPTFKEWNVAEKEKLSLEAYTKAIDAADEKKDATGAFRLCVQSIVRHGADDDFPQRLWRAANYADWVQRQGKTPIAPAVCDQLLDLCDTLPHTDDYFYEGRLLRATRRANAGDRAGEQAILQEILALPDLQEGYGLHTKRRVATGKEADGNYAEALKLYQSIEPLATSYRTAAESMLRATFINLHLGNDAEALRLIELLRQVPKETLNEATTKAQIEELVQLVQTGHAAEVWAAGRRWWPTWRKFAEAWATESSTSVIPTVTDLHELGTEMGEAKRDKDVKTYVADLDRIVSAARWLPSYGVEVASLFEATTAVIPGRTEELRKIVIAVLEMPHPAEIANYPGSRLQLAAHYIDGKRPADALKVVAAYPWENLPDDEIAYAMRRLGALGALDAKKDYAPHAAALERDLAGKCPPAERVTTVRLLADLYHRLGRVEDEEKLLKHELEIASAPTGSADGKAALQTRLNQLVGERDFNRELDAWRKTVTLPWYDYAEPHDLDDPRLKSLDDSTATALQNMVPAEQAKLHLLAASDPRRTLAQRQQSFRNAVQRLLELAPTRSRFDEVIASVVDNANLDEESRLLPLWMGLTTLNAEVRVADYQRWRKHELCDRFNAKIKANLAILDQVVATDRTSPDALLQLATALSENEITAFGGYALSDTFDYIVRTGDMAAAERFTALIPNWKLASDATDTVQTRQLDYARRLRRAKSRALVHDQLIAAAKARFPTAPDALPRAYDDLRIRGELPICSPEDTRNACLYLIKIRRFATSDFDFWGVFLRSLTREPGLDKFVGDAFAAAMAAADSDELRRELAYVFTNNCDTDDPAVREALRKVIAHEVDPKLHPTAYLYSRLVEAKLTARLGEPLNPETFFNDVTDPNAQYFKQLLKINAYSRTNDHVALWRTMEGMRTNVLLSPGLLNETIPAFEKLGRTDELKVARDVGKTELQHNIAQSWASYDRNACIRALALAETLKDPTLLPPAWVEEMSAKLSDPFRRSQVLVTSAVLQEDWPTVEKVAAQMNRDYPTHYHLYWYHGLASAKLKHNAEAREALQVYTRYSKDETEYAQAMQLLQELGTQ